MTKQPKPRILCVDDDENLLNALKRNLHHNFEVVTASSGQAALDITKEQVTPFEVFVVDMRMPGMDGIKTLEKLQKLSPDTSRIMLTGNAEQQTASDAINKGHIFRFLTKPASSTELLYTIADGVKQYRLITAERELLEKTLGGSIKLLFDLLAMSNPVAFQHAVRLKGLALKVGKKLEWKNLWQLEMAAMLSFIGYATLPAEIVEKGWRGEALGAEEKTAFRHIPGTSRDLLKNIPRFENIATIVYYTQKHFDGSGYPDDDLKGTKIPPEARLIKILGDVIGHGPSRPLVDTDIIKLEKTDGIYDTGLLAKVKDILSPYMVDIIVSHEQDIMELGIHDLVPGLILLDDLMRENGHVIFPAGVTLSKPMLKRIYNMHNIFTLKEPVKVKPDKACASDEDSAPEQ